MGRILMIVDVGVNYFGTGFHPMAPQNNSHRSVPPAASMLDAGNGLRDAHYNRSSL